MSCDVEICKFQCSNLKLYIELKKSRDVGRILIGLSMHTLKRLEEQ